MIFIAKTEVVKTFKIDFSISHHFANSSFGANTVKFK